MPPHNFSNLIIIEYDGYEHESFSQWNHCCHQHPTEKPGCTTMWIFELWCASHISFFASWFINHLSLQPLLYHWASFHLTSWYSFLYVSNTIGVLLLLTQHSYRIHCRRALIFMNWFQPYMPFYFSIYSFYSKEKI